MNVIIPGRLPNMNDIINASKKHWSEYNRLKKENTEMVAMLCRHLPKIKKVNLIITWYCPNRRADKDNVMAGTKFILDGLQQSGKIDNDGWDQVGEIIHRFEIDRKNPRVHIRLIEVKA